MIDWVRLLFHVCWILGASWLLSEYSFKSWEKREGIPVASKSLRNRQIGEISAIVMIGIGLAVTAHTWWQRILWIVVAVLLIVNVYLATKPSSN